MSVNQGIVQVVQGLAKLTLLKTYVH